MKVINEAWEVSSSKKTQILVVSRLWILYLDIKLWMTFLLSRLDLI